MHLHPISSSRKAQILKGSAAATLDVMSLGVSKHSLRGLAAQWEEDRAIRRSARECGRLVHWVSPETVGIASMTHVCKSTFCKGSLSEACMTHDC